MRSSPNRLAVMLTSVPMFLTALLVGCGGGGSPSTRLAGVATFNIVWPERSRLIPEASKSIKIEVTLDGELITKKVVPRPATGNTSTVKIAGLPVDTVTNTASAFPNADGTGVALATGTAPLEILEDGSATVTITMETTIDHIELSGGGAQSVAVGKTFTVIATPRDKAGAQVLIKPNTLVWGSSDPRVLSGAVNDNKAVFYGEKIGDAVVTVTEPESKRSANIQVQVTYGCVVPGNTGSSHAEWVNVPPLLVAGQSYTFQLRVDDLPNKRVVVQAPGAKSDWVLDGVQQGEDTGPEMVITTPGVHTIGFKPPVLLNGVCWRYLAALGGWPDAGAIVTHFEVQVAN